MEFNEDIQQTLKDLGLRKAFNDDAEFTFGKDSTISEAFHKTFFKFNEKGTEAAALSVFMTKETFYPGMVSPQIVFMVVDRPFLLFIQHKPTSTYLFSGMIQSMDKKSYLKV
eukprot:TRINITY_DN4492_c0_g1_i1.p1 TRINITY_DN4492_c0_g1~~TRINITY_DN4492_c0_g1_i1.p1  ORF type:complete len:112 (+),score=17.56 TRINITY_DN4492_c0_g1_i1:1-336(+)